MNNEIGLIDKIDNKIILKDIICSNCGFLVKYQHKHCPIKCPKCEDIYWNKPLDEYILFHLQDKFLETKDNNILAEMYKVLKEYTKKLMVRQVKNKYYFKKEELEINAHEAVTIVIVYYLTKPYFKISTSFGGYMKIGPIRFVLYGDKKEENNDSLNVIVDNEDNELENMILTISEQSKEKMVINFEDEILDKNSTIIDEIMGIFNKVCSKINKEYDKFVLLSFLIGIKHRFKRLSENFMDNYYLYVGTDVKSLIEKCMFVIYKYLKGNV